MVLTKPLTKEEADAIADAFEEAAEAINKYLQDNYGKGKIDREEYHFLNDIFTILQRQSTVLTTYAVGLRIDTLQDPAADLTRVTKQAKKKIKELQTVGRIISFATGLLNLTGGFMAKDPAAIGASVANLWNLIRG